MSELTGIVGNFLTVAPPIDSAPSIRPLWLGPEAQVWPTVHIRG